MDKKEYMRIWRLNNKEAMAKQNKAWREKNKEKYTEYQAAWHRANRKKVHARHKQWKLDNPTYHSEWKKENADKVRGYTRKRRMLMSNTESEEYSALDIYNRDKWICQLCKDPVDYTATGHNPKRASIDHIIPVSKGGNDTTANVQLTHFDCNLRKGATYDKAS